MSEQWVAESGFFEELTPAEREEREKQKEDLKGMSKSELEEFTYDDEGRPPLSLIFNEMRRRGMLD